MALPLDQLDLLATPADLLAGAPLQLPIDAIEEDPDQPRQEFDPDGLAELAETIKERGVRQPISVRRHPEKPDRWMLNFGARRLRASKLIGKLDIPAFVDNTADSYDQVIENEQREGLKPLELALFVQRRLAAGDTQAVIARCLGKSRAYVTYAMALVDAPDWLMAAYREGRCRGLRELYELRRAGEESGPQAESWVQARRAITRSDVADLKSAITAQRDRRSAVRPGATSEEVVRSAGVRPAPQGPALRVLGCVEGQWVVVCLDRVPEAEAHAFVRAQDAAAWRVVPISIIASIRLVSD